MDSKTPLLVLLLILNVVITWKFSTFISKLEIVEAKVEAVCFEVAEIKKEAF
jgi:hypothetical protein